MKFRVKSPLFEMANITKERTGLPVSLWVDSEGRDRSSSHSTQRVKIRDGDKEISISFYGEPKIEAGFQNVRHFGEGRVNSVISYISAHRSIFLAHWNKEIDDGEIIMALTLLRKNPQLSDEEAISQAKIVSNG